jgi:hypothetical protein
LNQKGLPAASLTPATGLLASGTIKLGGVSPSGTNVTEWKPLIFQRTLSPLWTVMTRR